MGGSTQHFDNSIIAQLAELAEERRQIRLENERLTEAEERFDRAERRLFAAEAAGIANEEDMEEFLQAAVELMKFTNNLPVLLAANIS